MTDPIDLAGARDERAIMTIVEILQTHIGHRHDPSTEEWVHCSCGWEPRADTFDASWCEHQAHLAITIHDATRS